MNTRSRAGSAFLFCLALSGIVVVIGYGFVRASMRDTVAGDRSQHVLLAQAAARAGLSAATEAIIADYASTTLDVGAGNAGKVAVTDPPTFLDGPYRAPFVSLTSPDRLYNVDTNLADTFNDVGAWNTVINPMTRLFDHNTLGQTTSRHEWHTNGIMLYDGRGRFIEPNYHNVTRPTPAAASPTPVVPTKVLDLAASAERHNGLFLDSSLRRVTSDGTPAGDQAARASARYRLRYAIGVIDLGGHLLSNPKADLNFNWQDAGNEYRLPPPWLKNAAEAWYNMCAVFPTYSTMSSNLTMPLRWQHVFQGRGNAANYDRRPVTSFPVTFPMMFRQRDGVTSAGPPIVYNGVWSMYAAKVGGPQGNSETTGLLKNTGTTATAAGNDQLRSNGFWDAYVHLHTGPQQSWFNTHQSVQGSQGGSAAFFDGGYYYGEQAPVPETAMFMPTPFGRGASVWSGAGTRKWYEGRVNTPWLVNVLTAPPRVIDSMLFAYLPPSFKKFYYTEENFSKSGSKSTMMGAWLPIVPAVRRGPRGHDLFTELAGPAFSEWPAPTDTDGVKPNFLAPDTRTTAQIYPGVMWNSADHDDLGKLINVNTLVATPYCSHSSQTFMPNRWAQYEGLNSYGSGWKNTPPAGWGAVAPATNGDWFFQRLGADAYYSYWWDIMTAFHSAVAVTRAAWVQYPTGSITPNTAFAGTLVRNPTLYDSIEELDRLFLRQLGEEFANPGSGTKLQPITCSGSSNQVYSEAAAVSHTIKTLVAGGLIDKGTYTSAERGRLMERVLNDFRMSFFGSSPQMYDSFRPLDFDGDRTKVMASCYASSGDPDEVSKGIDRYTTVFDGTYGPGQGAPPDADKWFSLAGTFYIGKSHYFRLLCRGELFDNVVQRPVSDATLESVLVVDPEGTDITQTHHLFQRWHFNRFTGSLSLIER